MKIMHTSGKACIYPEIPAVLARQMEEMCARGCEFYYHLQPSLCSTQGALVGTLGVCGVEGQLGTAKFYHAEELNGVLENLVLETYARTSPKIGQIVQHYHGGLYTVENLARNSESRDQRFVIYRSHERNITWVRPLYLWNEIVEWPGGAMLPRFMSCLATTTTTVVVTPRFA